ncbi:AAA family ATPase [Trichocoleus sp. FACHB-591]|uniref:AAA family ATPase n=1 Tax=Trichocoleus sp. FACHB-591 TaxID=2692872 RepID=UPI001689E74F|nr:AAA family ATPase [Trichocoleus sp. FACHB-591]MBD2094475.1 AAA family ATPase [Trichocoleus sp. FACHB-591]
MKLTSLRMYNFRQFYGETPEIDLAGSGQRRITVIHGNNGSGKTTLLNAFTWILFGKFTAAFQIEDELVNKRALAEVSIGQPVECWAELMFEHGGKQYRVRRTRQAKQESDRIRETADEVVLWFAEEDGRWKKLSADEDPQQVINRVLPESLHQYFFFDGERIEKIVQSNKRSEIAEATKTLLGLAVLDRSVDHLKKVKKIFQDKLKFVGNAEVQQFSEQREKLEQDVETVEKRQAEIEQELIYQEKLKDEVSQRLRELGEVRQLQLRRDELEQQEKLEQEKLRQSKANLKLAISTRGYTVLLKDATAKFKQLVDGLRERGELPADVKQQFIRDLLARKHCICGSELCEGTDTYKQVEAYLSKAGLADVEETVIRMGAKIEGIENQVPKFWEEVELEQRNINQLLTSLIRIREALDEIRERLRNSPSEDIQKLQERLDDAKQRIRRLTLEQGEKNQQLKDYEVAIEQLERQIEKYQMVEERQILAQRRIKATDEAITCLQAVRANYDLLFRSQLETRIQEVFSKISITPYLPRLNEKYELTLEDSTTGRATPVAASQGESQILSLSFIGAIVDRVREWSKKQTGMFMGPDSDTFPLVMDSPFGALDAIHRRQVTRTIPILANQLVVLVSKTQWRDEVEKEMDESIGKMYVLSYHSPKQDYEIDSIKLRGEIYSLVQQSDHFEWTEVVEVS